MELDFEELQKEYEKLRAEYEEIKNAKLQYDEAIKKAYADPELREPLRQIIKKTAGLEIEDPPYEKTVKNELSKFEKKLAEMEAEKEKAMRENYEKQLRGILEEYGISGEEVKKFQGFISETGLMPTTLDGWRVAAQNYRRSLMAEPVLGRPKKVREEVTSKEFMEDPSKALDKVFLQALYGGKK